MQPELDLKDPEVTEALDAIAKMQPASEIIELAANSEVTLEGNFDKNAIPEFKPNDPAGPAPSGPEFTA